MTGSDTRLAVPTPVAAPGTTLIGALVSATHRCLCDLPDGCGAGTDPLPCCLGRRGCGRFPDHVYGSFHVPCHASLLVAAILVPGLLPVGSG